MKKPIQLVVFDFNGTLYDDLHLAYASTKQIFDVHGVPAPTLAQFQEGISTNWLPFYRDYGIPEHVSPEDMIEIRRAYFAEHGHKAFFRPSAAHVVRKLQRGGMTMGLVSGEHRPAIEAALETNGLTGCFSFIYASLRSDKAPTLSKAVADCGVEPECAVYVDDSEDGLKAAVSVGMMAIAITHPTAYHSAARLRQVTRHEIQDFSKLLNLIEFQS